MNLLRKVETAGALIIIVIIHFRSREIASVGLLSVKSYEQFKKTC